MTLKTEVIAEKKVFQILEIFHNNNISAEN